MPPTMTKPAAAPVLPAGTHRTPAPRSDESESEEMRMTLVMEMEIESYWDTKENLANGKGIRSPKIDAGGRSWYIFYYPNGIIPAATGAISVYFKLAAAADEGDDDDVDDVHVQYQFMVVEQFGGVRFKSPRLRRTIHGRTNMHGFKCFVAHEKLENSGSIMDGPFKIRCDVTVLEDKCPEPEPSVAPIAKPPCRELPAKAKATEAAPVSGLHADISRLLVAKEGKDVDFEVGGKVFAAHRCVLAARSSVFKAHLFGATAEENAGYVRVDGIIPEAFDALLHFVYTDALPEMDAREVELMAEHLLVAAERYDLKDLKSMMEGKLCSHVGVATALHSLVLAEQHGCHGLKKKCLDFIASGENARRVMQADGAERLVKTCPSVVRDLVVKIMNTPRSELSAAKIVFYAAVSAGILNLSSVAVLKLCAVVLMALLVFVRYHG